MQIGNVLKYFYVELPSQASNQTSIHLSGIGIISDVIADYTFTKSLKKKSD